MCTQDIQCVHATLIKSPGAIFLARMSKSIFLGLRDWDFLYAHLSPATFRQVVPLGHKSLKKSLGLGSESFSLRTRVTAELWRQFHWIS